MCLSRLMVSGCKTQTITSPNPGSCVELNSASRIWDQAQQKDINYVSKRRRKNNSHTIEAWQDARTSVQYKRQKLYNRREACEGTRQRMRWMLCPEGPLHVQEYKERPPAAPGIT